MRKTGTEGPPALPGQAPGARRQAYQAPIPAGAKRKGGAEPSGNQKPGLLGPKGGGPKA
jgi:hypothetical protein